MSNDTKTLNQYCPRSGNAIALNSLTQYEGHTVGFCNPACRDDFRTNMAHCDKDRAYFDVLIKEKTH
jgi:hypothetical protein